MHPAHASATFTMAEVDYTEPITDSHVSAVQLATDRTEPNGDHIYQVQEHLDCGLSIRTNYLNNEAQCWELFAAERLGRYRTQAGVQRALTRAVEHERQPLLWLEGRDLGYDKPHAYMEAVRRQGLPRGTRPAEFVDNLQWQA